MALDYWGPTGPTLPIKGTLTSHQKKKKRNSDFMTSRLKLHVQQRPRLCLVTPWPKNVDSVGTLKTPHHFI